MSIKSVATHRPAALLEERRYQTKVAIFKAMILTFEPLLGGLTFARCRTKLDDGRTGMVRIYTCIF